MRIGAELIGLPALEAVSQVVTVDSDYAFDTYTKLLLLYDAYKNSGLTKELKQDNPVASLKADELKQIFGKVHLGSVKSRTGQKREFTFLDRHLGLIFHIDAKANGTHGKVGDDKTKAVKGPHLDVWLSRPRNREKHILRLPISGGKWSRI